MRKIGCWLILLFLVLGCIPDLPVQPEPLVEGYPEGAKVTVRFSVTDAGHMPATKALGEKPDLDSLFLAVFGSSGYLKEYVKADITHKPTYQAGDTVLNFEATLTLSDKERSVHFIGNGPSTLDFGYANEILPQLLSANGGQAFWQIKDSVLIQGTKTAVGYEATAATNAQFENIPLIRNYSKIVLFSDTAYFKPDYFAVFNVPSKGAVAPFHDGGFVKNYQDYGFTDLTSIYPGNLPDSTTFVGTPDEWDTRKAKADSAVYLYERPVPTEQFLPTYVIVHGKYMNEADSIHRGNEYYYKIDLMEGGEYYPILRNFKYQIHINKILSIGHLTPQAAAASAGSADVSADITTSHLSDISDGEARLVVQPWMAQTFIKKQTKNNVLHVKFFDDVMNGEPNMAYGTVHCDTLAMPAGQESVFESYSIGYPVQASGTDKGWRTITFTTKEPGAPGTPPRTQVLRISGDYKTETGDPRTLYRDVRITLQPLQQMQLTIESPDDLGQGVPRDTAKVVRLKVGLPINLTESMFPITFTIEPEDLSLTPDNQVDNNNLPVLANTSISDHAEYAGKRAFQFRRTLTYEEYKTLPQSLDLDGDPIRTFICYFKTTRRDNATTIWVANEYFSKAHVSFSNTPADRLNYFYVQAREDNIESCTVKLQYSGNGSKVEYKKNDEAWARYTSNSELRLKHGDKVYFRGNVKSWSGYDKFEVTGGGKFEVGGNLASLFVNDFTSTDIDANWGTDATGWTFQSFFMGETGLVDASKLTLPMSTMSENGYRSMFQGCTNLTAAPALPATTLANNCYQDMFYGCTRLTASPVLRADVLAKYCYYRMFFDCSSLDTLTMIATDISANNCLTNWVSGVASTGDFYGHVKASIPVGVNGVPSGWVDRNEFYVEAVEDGTVSFDGSGLQYSKNWEDWTSEGINSISVAAGDIVRFRGVRSSGTISSTGNFNVAGNILSLAAEDYTSVTTGTFEGIFKDAEKLVSAGGLVLPTTLQPNCFKEMFSGCSSLTTIPRLPVLTLVENCYQEMFKGCSLLAYVDCFATTNLGDGFTTNWLADVAGSGVFVKNINANWPSGPNGIPVGWEVPTWEGFYVEAVDNVTVKINVPSLYYSTNTLDWTQYTQNSSITVTAGNRVWFKGTFTGTYQDSEDTKFHCTGGRFKVGGNIMALRYADEYAEQGGGTCDVVFANMFKNHNGSSLGTLVDASKLVLPSTILSKDNAYKSFFDGCTSLTAGPAELPATTLTATCYRNMFKDCPNLVTGPRILAVSSNSSAFQQMFLNCSSLQYIYIMVSTCPSGAFTNWVNGVPAGGTFVKNSNNNAWGTSGNASIPSGWTVQSVNP